MTCHSDGHIWPIFHDVCQRHGFWQWWQCLGTMIDLCCTGFSVSLLQFSNMHKSLRDEWEFWELYINVVMLGDLTILLLYVISLVFVLQHYIPISMLWFLVCYLDQYVRAFSIFILLNNTALVIMELIQFLTLLLLILYFLVWHEWRSTMVRSEM